MRLLSIIPFASVEWRCRTVERFPKDSNSLARNFLRAPVSWFHSLSYYFMLLHISTRIGNCKNLKSKSLLIYIFPHLFVELQWPRKRQRDWLTWLSIPPPARGPLIRNETPKRWAVLQGTWKSTQTRGRCSHTSSCTPTEAGGICTHPLGKLSIRNLHKQ